MGSAFFFMAAMAARAQAPSVAMTFQVVTANTGGHTALSAGNAVTVHYLQPDGSPASGAVWDGADLAVDVQPSSEWSYSALGADSTTHHRWASGEVLSGTAPASGSQTVSIAYYDQYKPGVTLSGTDASHTVSTEAHTLFGVAHPDSALSGTWSDWCDAGSQLAFSAFTTGTPVRTTHDLHSGAVSAYAVLTIHYGVYHTLTVHASGAAAVPVGASPVDADGLSNGTTDFTRVYEENTTVTLTAPARDGGSAFRKWLAGGLDFPGSSSPAIQVGMDGDQMLTAVYTLIGDLNADGQVTEADAQAAFDDYMQGLTAAEHPEADVDQNQSITPADAQEIFEHVLDPSRLWP